MTDDAERLEALEIRLTHQDRTIEELNAVVTQQWTTIEHLRRAAGRDGRAGPLGRLHRRPVERKAAAALLSCGGYLAVFTSSQIAIATSSSAKNRPAPARSRGRLNSDWSDAARKTIAAWMNVAANT